MPTIYSTYGLTLISDIALPELRPAPEPLLASTEFVHVRLEANSPQAVDSLSPAFTSQYLTPSGQPRAHIYQDGPCLLLCFADIADFLVCPSSVTVTPAAGSGPAQVRLFLLGPALAFELELLGIPCLHASAVALEHGAVGFLAASTGGKSVLASSFVEAGATLLTDDILPLRRQGEGFVGGPGYPQMKIWPEAASELLGNDLVLDRLLPGLEKRRLPVGEQWGSFCTVPQPLLALYIPTRLESSDHQASEEMIEIAPISPRDALIELVRHIFCARVVEALGWQPRHLGFLAELVQCVPVRRLRYPSGFEHLPGVHAAVSRDIVRLGLG
jgi:hypothetical protein